MYNKISKRSILIFPKFNNINLIQNVRKTYDRLVNILPPHITLAFPFTDEISNTTLIAHLSTLLKNHSPFNVTFKGISLSDDNYIFLNCINGHKQIINLHNEIYRKIIPTQLNTSIKYIPHITLGQSESIDTLKNFNYEFNTIVDEVSIELIGKNEESIIIKNIKLGGLK